MEPKRGIEPLTYALLMRKGHHLMTWTYPFGVVERKTRNNGRETMAKILEHAKLELDAVGPVKFNILRVIESSGVSRSSMYHHFKNRDGVIAAVEVARMSEEAAFINLVLKQTIESVGTHREAMDAIRTVLVATGSDLGKKLRAHRIAVIATAQTIPLLSEQMREDQKKIDDDLKDILCTAESRGLTSPIANVDGVVHLITSLFIGRTMVDILGTEQADAAWVDATMASLEHLIPPRR